MSIKARICWARTAALATLCSCFRSPFCDTESLLSCLDHTILRMFSASHYSKPAAASQDKAHAVVSVEKCMLIWQQFHTQIRCSATQQSQRSDLHSTSTQCAAGRRLRKLRRPALVEGLEDDPNAPDLSFLATRRQLTSLEGSVGARLNRWDVKSGRLPQAISGSLGCEVWARGHNTSRHLFRLVPAFITVVWNYGAERSCSFLDLATPTNAI